MASLLNASGKLAVPTQADLQTADEVAEIICFVEGTLDDATPYWVYLALKPSKYASFISVTKAPQTFLLSDYGTVLRYGTEALVPVEAQEQMKCEYGFDDRYVDKLVKKAEAEQDRFLKQNEERRLGDIVAIMKKNQAGSLVRPPKVHGK
jgi:hypothetical protein